MSIESVMPSNNLILCHPLLLLPSIFPSIRVLFPMSRLFPSGGQSIGTSASASVLPMNIKGWFLLGLTGLISLLSHLKLKKNKRGINMNAHMAVLSSLCELEGRCWEWNNRTNTGHRNILPKEVMNPWGFRTEQLFCSLDLSFRSLFLTRTPLERDQGFVNYLFLSLCVTWGLSTSFISKEALRASFCSDFFFNFGNIRTTKGTKHDLTQVCLA